MARANPFLSAFNAGEFSPRMVARVNFEAYDNAASLMENVILMPQGGFQRRPGSRYIAPVKDHAAETALYPFEFSTEQAYVIEAGNKYLRFFRNQAQLVTANIGATITNGDFTSNITGWTDQSAGTGAIAHNATTGRLSLDGGGTGNEAIAEQAVTTATTGVAHTLRFAARGQLGSSFVVRAGSTSGASDYLADQALLDGYHTVTFTPTASPFYLQFEYAGAKSMEIDDVELLDNVPFEVYTPYDTSASASVLFEMKYAQSADVMYFTHPDYWPYRLLRRSATSWSFVRLDYQDGPYLPENTTTTTLALGATTGNTTLTASATLGINGGVGWLDSDINRVVRWKDAAGDWTWVRIFARTSSTVVEVEVLGGTASATTATTAWHLGAYSDTTGHPGAVALFEERLVFAGSSSEPQRFDLSVTADFHRFSPTDRDGTVADDNGLSYTIASEQVNRIRWVAATSRLILGATGGEFIVSSSGAALTPSDLSVRQNAANGSANVAPLKINNRVLFVQRAGRKLRDLRYDFNQDSYVATDTTILADHITKSGVKQMAYQQEPDSLAWVLRNDGQVATMVYEPGQQVVGWSRQVFGGAFSTGAAVCESLATIPGQDAVGQVFASDDRDEVWVIVKRTIDGNTRRYVEVIERAYDGPRREAYATKAAWRAAVLADQENAFYVDSGLTYDGAATTTISGLDHLEGETVDLWVDGAEHPQRVVASGSVTLDYEATKVQAGLPARWQFCSLKLPYGVSAGGSTGVVKTKRIHRAGYVLMDASAFRHGPTVEKLETLEFRVVSDPMDTAVPLFTGEYEAAFAGNNENDPRICLEGVGPGPFVCLAIAPEMSTNDFS